MKSQKGSAHVAIIIILVLALIGALGYIFWTKTSDKSTATTNSAEKKDNAKNETDRESAQSVPDGYVYYKDDETGYGLAYPKEWGSLKETAPQSSTITRLGASGESTKALADAKGITRISVYTKDSFFTTKASGYKVTYQGEKAFGADAGSETYNALTPLAGTDVYAENYGDAGFTSYDIFFHVGGSVVYVSVGDSKETQVQIAKTVKRLD